MRRSGHGELHCCVEPSEECPLYRKRVCCGLGKQLECSQVGARREMRLGPSFLSKLHIKRRARGVQYLNVRYTDERHATLLYPCSEKINVT